jgi:hypothetical protein
MLYIATKAAIVVVLAAQVAVAQSRTPLKPTAPGTAGDPAWQGILRLSDGRTFVTDGGLAIDVALAKPAKLPDRELTAKVLEGYLNTPHKDEFSLGQLKATATGKTYMTPTGIALNATYVNYLRRTLPAASARLRTTADRQPIAIVADGKVVGVLMPVAQ